MSLPEKTLRFSNRGALAGLDDITVKIYGTSAGLDDVTFDGRSSVPSHVTCTVKITEAATCDVDVTLTAIDTYALTSQARGQSDETHAAQPLHTMYGAIEYNVHETTFAASEDGVYYKFDAGVDRARRRRHVGF